MRVIVSELCVRGIYIIVPHASKEEAGGGWMRAAKQFTSNSVKGMVVETEHFSDDAGWRTVNCVCVCGSV